MLRFSLCAIVAAGALACGKIKTVEPADPDAAVDETDAGEDVTPGEVSVTVHDQFNEGAPLVGAPVLFFGPDGALLEEVETDDDGMASGTVPPHSVVVALATWVDGEPLAMAVLDVRPGDEIVFQPRIESPSASALLGSMDITVPALGKDSGVDSYSVYTGCSTHSSDTNVINDVTFYSSCLVDGEFDILVRAFDVSNEVIETTSAHGTFAADGPVVIASWKGVDDLEIPVTQVPTELRQVSYEVEPAIGAVSYGAVATPSIEPAGSEIDVSLAKLDTFGDRLNATARYEPTQDALGNQIALHVLEPDADALPQALDQALLPWIGSPIYSDADQQLSWSRTGDGRAPDAQYLLVVGTHKAAEDEFFWIVAVPPDRTSVAVPELPAEFEEYALGNVATLQALLILAAETSEYDGYDIRRAGVFGFWNSFQGPQPGQDVGFLWQVSFGGSLFL